MGNKTNKQIARTENEFWNQYYKRTRDYSVGYAATISIDQSVNKENHKRTRRILQQYRCPNGFYLPDPKHLI